MLLDHGKTFFLTFTKQNTKSKNQTGIVPPFTLKLEFAMA